MSINAIIDGTTYEGISTILTGGKTISLSEESGGYSYPALSFCKDGNTSITNGKMQLNAVNVTRAFIYRDSPICGGVQYTKNSGLSSYTMPVAFPLYIPYGATKISVICPNLSCAINVHEDIDGTVTAVDNGYWSELGGETDYDLSTFIANGATHLSIGLKNADGTSLAGVTIDSTTVQVIFS